MSYNKYLGKYKDFSFNHRKFIKDKYKKKKQTKIGIYLWVNNLNNKSYVGKQLVNSW